MHVPRVERMDDLPALLSCQTCATRPCQTSLNVACRSYWPGAPRINALAALSRGVVRQLGRPALLAAMYSGDGPGAAAAAMAEVGTVLASSLHELERGSAGGTGAIAVI